MPAAYWNLVHIISDSCNSAWVDISIVINPILQMTTLRLREVTIPKVMILSGWRCCHNDSLLFTPISQQRTLRPREVHSPVGETFCCCGHEQHVWLLSRVRLFAIPQTVARQAPLSRGFSRQEYWSGLPCPPPGDPPFPGTELAALRSPASAGRFFTASTTGKPLHSPPWVSFCDCLMGSRKDALFALSVNTVFLIKFRSFVSFPNFSPFHLTRTESRK